MKYTADLPQQVRCEEDASAVRDHGVDGLALAHAEGGIRPGDRTQQFEGAVP
jgi:hypothetical protein